MNVPRRVLVLGLGEGGGFLVRALRADGSPEMLRAYDAGIADPDLAVTLRRRAAKLEVDLYEDLGHWVAEVDLVFSLVPGTAAVEAARSVRPYLRRGTLYVDLNSITAETMRDVAAVFDGAGVRVVDGAVLGNFRAGGRIPILLAGAAAERVREVLPSRFFHAELIEGRPGDASAVKMLRSVVLKGLEALFVECLVAAEIQGLRGVVLEAFRDLDERPFAKTMEIQTVTHLVHAARRLKEVERVASVLHADGLDGTMTEATRRLFAATVDAGVAPSSGEPLSLDETLAALVRVYRKPAPAQAEV